MLSFDIRSLESRAVKVEGDLPATDSVWTDTDLRPIDDVTVAGRLSAAGDDRFYFSGSIAGAAKLECRRCLTDVTVEVDSDVHFLFAPIGDPTTEDDPDVFIYDPSRKELNIAPAVREQWLLEVPAFAECKEDCKGLCLTCGSDLNAGPCDCKPAQTDARWDALRQVRDQLHPET
ncbi:MAG: YceD family protein [Gemmatimonadaceae bacterium]